MADKRPTCAFCRHNEGDAFLHDDLTANAYRCGTYWVICFDCIEALIERENALAEHGNGRDGLFRVFDDERSQVSLLGLQDSLPDIWDRPPRPLRRQ